MKISILLLLAILCAEANAGDVSQVPTPVTEVRLSDASDLPTEFREAAAAVYTKLTAAGDHPDEYFVSCSRRTDGMIEIYIRHESHDVQKYEHWRGDGCGKCRQAIFAPATKTIGRLFGIR